MCVEEIVYSFLHAKATRYSRHKAWCPRRRVRISRLESETNYTFSAAIISEALLKFGSCEGEAIH